MSACPRPLSRGSGHAAAVQEVLGTSGGVFAWDVLGRPLLLLALEAVALFLAVMALDYRTRTSGALLCFRV